MDERRLFLAFLISLVILIGWQMLVPGPEPPPETPPVSASTPETAEVGAEEAAPTPTPEPEETGIERAGAEPQETEGQDTEVPATGAEAPAVLVAADAEQRVVIERDRYRVELTNRGAQLVSFVLAKHQDNQGDPLDLVRRRAEGPYPLALLDRDLGPLPLDDALFAVERSRDEEDNPVVRFRYRGEKGAAEKVLRFLPGGVFEVEVQVEGVEGWGLLLGPAIRNPQVAETKGSYTLQAAVYRQAGEVETVKSGKNEEMVTLPGEGLSWVGLEDTYFLTVLIPETPLAAARLEPVAVEGEPPDQSFLAFTDVGKLSEEKAALPRELRVVVQSAGESLAIRAYFGDKDYERLAAMPYGLEETVRWGIFGFLSRPLLIGLVWIHDHVVANYGWAIVLMTILLKIVLFPLTQKSQKSMLRMQKLQPRMQAIRQKYKGKLRDGQGRFNVEAQRKMNEELQALYREEGVNPMGGCLPMVLQIPVFFAFFRLLPTAVELRRAPWILWIKDLSAPDPIYLLPLMMGASQIYQQKLTPTSAEPMQRRIMQLVPIVFTVVSFSFPSGLVLYWTVNNLTTILQMALYNRFKQNGPKSSSGKGAGREKGSGKGKRRRKG